MANTTITVNGQVLAPSSIEETHTKIGDSKRMADGTLRFFFRSIKRSWKLSWENAPEGLLAAAYTAYAATVPFVFTDQFGNSFTVISDGEFTRSVDASNTAANGAFYYSFDFTVNQV